MDSPMIFVHRFPNPKAFVDGFDGFDFWISWDDLAVI